MANTVKALVDITDEGVFERLAMAILREYDSTYDSLIHTGVNAAGKTITSPVDGVMFAVSAGGTPTRLVAVHHTIAARRDLRRKWMQEPGVRRSGKSVEPGDFVKTREIVRKERVADSGLAATLILTSSVDPPEDLVRDVHAAGRAEGIDVEFWPGSRLAHQLDVGANGQWLRRLYLGIEPERLSTALLARLSLRSLGLFPQYGDSATWVSRALDSSLSRALEAHQGVFVVAEGGLGKSVACQKLLKQHIEQGGFGLTVSEATAAESSSPEAAIGIELRKLQPQLVESCEAEALALCTEARPFLIICEDVSRTGRPQALIERLADWLEHKRGPWRLVCPLRPDAMNSLSDQAHRNVQKHLVTATTFTPDEGRAAVVAKAKSTGVAISDLDAMQLSSHLGHDPLLIALNEIGAGRSPQVIEAFIDRSVSRLASQTPRFSRGELRRALRILADRMLQELRLDLKWDEVTRWAEIERHLEASLRALVHHGEVVRISDGPVERILFRHDRVRDALLVEAIGVKLTSGSVDDAALDEPFFAEHLGSALLRDGVPEEAITLARRRNPLALFSALREFGEPNTPFKQAIVAHLRDWLASEEGHSIENATLRWQAVNMLADTTSTAVQTVRFPDWSHPQAFALFRNGSLDAGIMLCQTMEPGVTAPWYERQIDHVLKRFGNNLIKAIGTVLEKPGIDSATRVGVLRLAGYTYDERLAPAIETCWNADVTGRDRHLDDYIWAAANCCGKMDDRLLGPICDAWGRLPQTPDGGAASPRDDLAANHIRWAFRARAPVHAIKFFVARAVKDDLKWPLLYMLHSIDHPDALEFAIRQFAAFDDRGSFVAYALDLERQWQSSERKMSAASRTRLLSLWMNVEEHGSVRQRAFKAWSAAGDRNDLETLRSARTSELFATAALQKQLEYGDMTVTAAILERLDDPQKSYHWWRELPPIWSSEMSMALTREMKRRSASIALGWKSEFATDRPVSELVMSIPSAEAERLLIEHWDQLRCSRYFLTAALYVASPRLVQMASEAVRDCPNPSDIFQHLEMRYGIRTVGRPGLTRREQVEALGAFVELFDDLTIHTLWDWCNEKGWHDLRRRFFDRYVDRKYARLFLDDETITVELDKLAEPQRHIWVGDELEAWTKTGASLEEIMAFIDKWLGSRPTIERFQVAAAAVGYAGARRHIAILDRECDVPDLAERVRHDVWFRVRRRTLQ